MDTVRVLSSVLVIILAVHSSPSDSLSIEEASNDYGNIVHVAPSAVLSPSSVGDVIRLVNSSYASETPFTVAARGQAHSVRGQAMSPGGVVVDMAGLSRNDTNRRIEIRDDDDDDGPYADVGGEVTWIDVLRATAERGLAPVTWTDYLYLSVGGTLSNAGISGQAFRRGPHISNVVEMDVVTGKGEFMTCSKNKHQELFFSVLGGLGQFGIITRARIPLAVAPTRVKWARVIYTDFASFSSDQERLISGSISKTPDYVEGFLIADADTTNEWRSSFSTPSRQSDIVNLLKKQPILYSIELVKYYYHDHHPTSAAAQKEFEAILKELSFIRSLIFSTDTSFSTFIERVPNLAPKQSESHPWLNLLIPKSRISDFNAGVLTSILPKFNELQSSPPIYIFYPLNKNKWDDRTSAVIPSEEVFYLLGLLHAASSSDYAKYDDLNSRILEFCRSNGIDVKEYLPHFESREDWREHFGDKWETFRLRKTMFDPRFIMGPGQRIFN